LTIGLQQQLFSFISQPNTNSKAYDNGTDNNYEQDDVLHGVLFIQLCFVDTTSAAV